MEKLLTPDQVAELFQISRLTVLKWLRTGKLPGVKLGTGPKAEWRVTEEQLREFIKKMSTSD